MSVFAFAVLIGAWLTFQIQPILAKMILPEFGGLAVVWTSSLVFFQAMLLAGYAYAHILARCLPARKAWYVHLVMLAASAWWLPPLVRFHSPLSTDSSLTWSIVVTLAASIAVPFVALAGTGPLLQWWWTTRYSAQPPYRLYAASNAGSLLGLLVFPVVFEPLFGLTANARWWAVGFVVLAVACWFCRPAAANRDIAPSDSSNGDHGVSDHGVRALSLIMWLGWSSMSCAMMMAVSHVLCQEVASFPFLWVIPLAAYLTSFIVAFGWPRIYRRQRILVAYLATACWSLLLLLLGTRASLFWQMSGFGAVCFFGSWLCHGELYASRPATRHLTLFYLMIATGGLLGGIMVVVLAPRLFSGFYEFQWAVSLIALTVASLTVRQQVQRLGRFGWGSGCWLFATLGVIALMIATTMPPDELGEGYRYLFRGRSEYGLVSVYETPEYRQIVSGQTGHGRQFHELPKRLAPIDYYHSEAGAGIAVRAIRETRARRTGPQPKPLKIGVIGLGGGCLTTWTEAGDEIVFYEINPQIAEGARTYFSYLDDSRGTVEVRLGDGRKVLEEELRTSGSRQFDILFVDAFTSDSIPVHLLTRECRDLYWQHVRRDGLVAFHISNRFVDLLPVVYDEQGRMDRQAILIDRLGVFPSKWVLVTADRELLELPLIGQARNSLPEGLRATAWTDDYSTVFWLVDWMPWIEWKGFRPW